MSLRHTAYRRGVWAEYIAALYLFLRGWQILEMRYKTPVGEIDILARRGGVLAAVEVKARMSEMAAMESVSPKNRQRVERAVAHYLSYHPACAEMDIRFDVIALSGVFRLTHLDNAWRARS